MEPWRDELYHHGIKGQQWGVSHGPPYPVNKDNHVTRIKAGTKITRISRYDESKSKGHAYVTYNNLDKERYKGFFAGSLNANPWKKKTKVYQVEMEAKKDLVAPDNETKRKFFKEMYAGDKEFRKQLGDYHKDNKLHTHAFLPRKFYEKKFSELNQYQLDDIGYKTFVSALGGNEYIRSAYFNKLAKSGYNFVNDDLDAGKKFGKEPAIIIDRKKSTKYLGQRELSSKEINENWRKYGTHLRKGD